MVEIPPSNARDLGLISGQELTCSGATKPACHREDQRNQKKKKKKNSQARKGEGLLYRNSPISFYNSESY